MVHSLGGEATLVGRHRPQCISPPSPGRRALPPAGWSKIATMRFLTHLCCRAFPFAIVCLSWTSRRLFKPVIAVQRDSELDPERNSLLARSLSFRSPLTFPLARDLAQHHVFVTTSCERRFLGRDQHYKRSASSSELGCSASASRQSSTSSSEGYRRCQVRRADQDDLLEGRTKVCTLSRLFSHAHCLRAVKKPRRPRQARQCA